MFNVRNLSLVVAALSAALPACTALRPTPVKDILTDRASYLEKNFTLPAARAGVSGSIASADRQSLGFSKVVLKMKVEQQFGAKDVTRPDVFDTETYVNLGGPYLQRIAEDTSNDLSVSQTFMLSYRGLLSLRWQDVYLNRAVANPINEIKSFKSLAAWPANGPGTGSLDYDYQWAPTYQIANYYNVHWHCDFGRVMAASSISPKLEGEAQTLDCRDTNNNGVIVDRSQLIYFVKYGFATMVHLEGASTSLDKKIVDADVL